MRRGRGQAGDGATRACGRGEDGALGWGRMRGHRAGRGWDFGPSSDYLGDFLRVTDRVDTYMTPADFGSFSHRIVGCFDQSY